MRKTLLATLFCTLGLWAQDFTSPLQEDTSSIDSTEIIVDSLLEDSTPEVSIQAEEEPIAITDATIIGEWHMSGKITGNDTTTCKVNCPTVSILDNDELTFSNAFGAEKTYGWIREEDTLHFENLEKKKRRKKDLRKQFSERFIIIDRSTSEVRSIELKQEELGYSYILTYVPEEEW